MRKPDDDDDDDDSSAQVLVAASGCGMGATSALAAGMAALGVMQRASRRRRGR